MKSKRIGILITSFVLAFLLFQKQIVTHSKVLLLLSEEFPQIPIKPLQILTNPPSHEQFEFRSRNGKIVADLLIPSQKVNALSQQRKPAIILAMGIKTAEKDKPIILHLADTLARLGYVVMWPRREVLEKGKSLPEDPQTFVAAFEYLKTKDIVDTKRISFIGFSVGSSTAFVAASQSEIKNDVHSLIFFGGYYDIFDYFLSLASKTAQFEGRVNLWNPHKDAVGHAKEILKEKQADGLIKIFDAQNYEEAKEFLKNAPKSEIEELRKLSPKESVGNFRSKAFILHERSDSYVPYGESIKLKKALPKKQLKRFLIVNLFEHVQPKKTVSWEILPEFLKLYGFLYSTLSYL